jgi:hypothetical protein
VLTFLSSTLLPEIVQLLLLLLMHYVLRRNCQGAAAAAFVAVAEAVHLVVPVLRPQCEHPLLLAFSCPVIACVTTADSHMNGRLEECTLSATDVSAAGEATSKLTVLHQSQKRQRLWLAERLVTVRVSPSKLSCGASSASSPHCPFPLHQASVL